MNTSIGRSRLIFAPRALAFKPGTTSKTGGKVPKSISNKTAVLPESAWRLFGVDVPLAIDPGKDDFSIHAPLRKAICSRLGCKVESLPLDAVKITRKSFDARLQKGKSEKSFEYVVDVLGSALVSAGIKRLEKKEGWMEPIEKGSFNLDEEVRQPSDILLAGSGVPPKAAVKNSPDPIVVVGSGPAGLFAALSLAEAGLKVILFERGQAVEQRGRDIGALFVRGRLDPDSNLCYGEGGAGTWSDGKLTTRIGRNSDPVRRVLQTLVDCGAPEAILMSGKPHLGTERLVKLLKNFRTRLTALGTEIHFGSTVSDLIFTDSRCTGVVLRSGEKIPASAVVLAVGHSARPLYQILNSHGVAMTAKSFAMGFRVEHPQSLIDTIRYGAKDAAGVLRGKGRIPVADYSLATQVLERMSVSKSQADESNIKISKTLTMVSEAPGIVQIGNMPSTSRNQEAQPPFIGDSFNKARTSSMNGDMGNSMQRGVYSFCMCPGGQIVPTSTNVDELCINGMSFSRRNSLWANSALVVTVQPEDWEHLTPEHGPLAGMALQAHYERVGATMGGGNFVAPVQRVTDFLEGRSAASATPLPSSSYRLGIKPSPLHNLFSPSLTNAIQQGLVKFNDRLPGFSSSSEGLLHGVETRTSAPVRIERSNESCESISHSGLFPCGEGAGYAGGIVSAAVDGLRVGQSILDHLCIQ